MNRRATVLALLAFGAALPIAGAQPATKVSRIGLLSNSADATQFPEKQTLDSLRGLGWIEGKNLVIERRFARGDPALLAAYAAELVALKVDLILTFGAGVGIAKQASQTVPIVFGTSADPVRTAFVASLGRPGANMTGATYLTDQLSAKRLELLKEMMPTMSRVSVLWEPSHIDNEFRGMQAVSNDLGVRLHSVEVPRPLRSDEIERAMLAVRQGRAEALVLVPGGFTIAKRKRIIALATEHRIPVMSAWRIFADDGALLTYGPNLPEIAHRIAGYVDRILKGARPEDLPVEGPSRFELVLNTKSARSLGIRIPQSLLIRADELID
jgi:putative tryptophan/tyrosine transport system substrate-binding protein